jgi:hypothetical protein
MTKPIDREAMLQLLADIDQSGYTPKSLAKRLATHVRTLLAREEKAVAEAVATERERLAARLEALADMYVTEEGVPGPMASAWGWRSIAKTYREEASEIRARSNP